MLIETQYIIKYTSKKRRAPIPSKPLFCACFNKLITSRGSRGSDDKDVHNNLPVQRILRLLIL